VRPRDLSGYGASPPRVRWPDGARLALSVVVNYEEGSELTPVLGDDSHEVLGELWSSHPPDVRDLHLESQWEYGARAGIWRLLRLLADSGVKATFFVCGLALELNPDVGKAITAGGHDVVAHGYRWTEQWRLGREEEGKTVRMAVAAIERTTGRRPLGWFTRTGPTENLRSLLQEEGFVYDCDAFNDDLPYYVQVNQQPWLVIPYAIDTNDGKFWRGGWATGREFLEYLTDSFDYLYEEGKTHPRLLSIGLHTRIAGRPGRAAAVARFFEYVSQFPDVWIAGRDDIARFWLEHQPPTDAEQVVAAASNESRSTADGRTF
jgi:peptidoglycan/xylan/chitin deacetylase (PgdA/CDA1 family)